MTQHLTIPHHDFEQRVDLRRLEYVGVDPSDPDTAILRGPNNIPFHLKVEPSKLAGVRVHEVSLHMMTLDHALSRTDSILSIVATMDLIVVMAVANDDIAALPTDHKARTLALLERLAGLLDIPAPEMRRGTFDEMCALLQAYASLANQEFKLYAASDMQKAPRVTARMGNQTLEIDTVPVAIARWFKPVGTQADLYHRTRADLRRPLELATFAPQPMSGHDKLDGLANLSAWLIAHYQEVDWTEDDLDSALARIGAPPRRAA